MKNSQKGFSTMAGLMVVLAIVVIVGGYYWYQGKIADKPVSSSTQTANGNIEYKNIEYGFGLTLPVNWQGFVEEKSVWNGYKNDSTREWSDYNGPLLTIKNPQGDKWQPIPIMVFTPEQWKLAEEEKVNFGAAPVGPSKIGQNAKYIFATPARWIGFVDYLGQEEAASIVETFKAY